MKRTTNCFNAAQRSGGLAAGPFRPYGMVRETRAFRSVWPIELCITRSFTALLTMFTSHLICTIKASQLAALVAFAWLLLGG